MSERGGTESGLSDAFHRAVPPRTVSHGAVSPGTAAARAGRESAVSRPLPGLYIHVPFCRGGKCPYCDFYSLPASADAMDAYCKAAVGVMEKLAPRAAGRRFGSVYFGGGTPSVLGRRLGGLLKAARRCFSVEPGAEITLEANPGTVSPALFEKWREAGFSRVSMGVQSAVPEELAALGRRHTVRDAENAVRWAKEAGFYNLSLDLMLAVPGQTPATLARSLDFAAGSGARHVSAYLLIVEPGTPFYAARGRLSLPGEDAACALYDAACDGLGRRGFRQYEISNFSVPGFEARHNLVYWKDGEYLGVGPAAHSFWNGRRFHWGRSLRDFCAGAPPADDGPGGGFDEAVMLGLRLCEGLDDAGLRAKTGRGLDSFDPAAVCRMASAGLVERRPGRLRLTRRGFLVSNSVIAELLAGASPPGAPPGAPKIFPEPPAGPEISENR